MSNPFRIFATKNRAPNHAVARITSNVFCPIYHRPKFLLQRSSTFFTTGSCFAREVEVALENLGIPLSAGGENFKYEWFSEANAYLPSQVNASDPDALVTRARAPIDRYSPHSMLYDLERVLEGKHSFEDTIIPLDGDNKVWDPQLKALSHGNLDFTRDVRGILDRIIRSMIRADVIIMTLGMTEGWYDKVSGAILPTPPSPLHMKKFPERFGYFEADYNSVLETLDTTIAKISAYSMRNPSIIITVSPVPMGSTFTDKDVIVANNYSKSTLVSAAHAIAKYYDQVDYFPSYEMVMNSAREIWHDDHVHIRQAYVAQIMKRFMECYFAD